MGVAHSIMGEMCNFTKILKRFNRTLEADCGVRYGPEYSKSQGWTIFEAVEVSDHRHMVVDSYSDNGNEHHHAPHGASSC